MDKLLVLHFIKRDSLIDCVIPPKISRLGFNRSLQYINFNEIESDVDMAKILNDQKKAIIWELWIKGSPMIDIARAIDKSHATVFSYLRYHGRL